MNFGKSDSPNRSSGLLIPTLIGIAILLVIGGFLISQLTDWLFATQASAEAEQIDELFRVFLGIGGGLFLLVQGLLLYSVIRFRKRKGDESDGPTIHGNVALELTWTAIPSVVVLVLVIYSYQVWSDIRAPKDNEMVVHGIGARYAWTFEYTDDRVDETISSNTLHTYVGRPVRMVLDAQDVIHSFWVPAMRIKQDLMPGRTTEISFTPTQAGRYRVVCAELCGAGHGQMWAWIEVYEDEETYLASFADPAVERILNPPEDPAELGRQVIQSYACTGCHVLDDLDWQGVTGPSLNNVGDTASRRIPGYTAEEYLYESVYYSGAFIVAGYDNVMPQYQPDDPDGPNYMPVEDVRAIVAYLCTLTDDGESACDLENLDAIIEADQQ
ncbi:MAG: cytochrome c oxidase subunit II [Phototrophicaceae bacterium]